MKFQLRNRAIPPRGDRNVSASELLELLVQLGHEEIGLFGRSKLNAALVAGAMALQSEFGLRQVNRERREFWEAVCKRPVSDEEMDWQESQLEVPGEEDAPVEESDLISRASRDLNECYDQLANGKGLKLQGSIVLRAIRLSLEHGGTGDLTSKLLKFSAHKIVHGDWRDPSTPEGKAYAESPLGRGWAEHKRLTGED